MAIPLRLSPCNLHSLSHSRALPPSPTHVLRLASSSFLDGVLTSDGAPKYTFDTRDSLTRIRRCTPTGLVDVASVDWPIAQHADPSGKGKKRERAYEVFVTIGQRHEPEFDLLRRSAFSSSRKFRVPHLPHTFKWRYVPTRDTFECAVSGSPAPLAVFEPANLTACARLRVFAHTLPEANEDELLDHLVTTALLVTTGPEAWRGIASPLPTYALLDADFADLDRRPTKASLAAPQQPLRRARSSCVLSRNTSTSSYMTTSSTITSAPPSPAYRVRPLAVDTRQHVLLDLDAPYLDVPYVESPRSAVSCDEDDELTPYPWHLWKVTDDASAPRDDDPPPPYEQIQFSVRVPMRTTTSRTRKA